MVGLAGMLLFSSVASSQTREPNKPIRADEGKTVVDQLSKNGSGGPAPRQDITGSWAGPASPKENPVPPMTVWGEEQFRAHKSHSHYSEAESNDPMKYCDPLGFPRDMLYQTRGIAFAPMPGRMIQLSQFNRVWREIWTDGRQLPKNVGGRSPDAPDPRWYGYSVGRWEGDYTFVVDTIGSDERSWLDTAGHPHSIDMRVQERYTRLDHNTLEVTITVDDSKAYTKPFAITTSHFKWIPNQELREEICVPSLMQEYLNVIGDPAGDSTGK
ncbi:MAG: hypothetical protein DMG32_26700 [Acidobacteria bacterium]|nr:MAG: hypothetical protein DMG32_26700 [Acidobacteriota bacterium]